MVRARWTAGVALALAAWAAGSAAYADERAEARQRFRAGIELVRQGQYLRGVEEFQAAYRILPNVNVLYNIARAYADAGEVERAIEYTQRYLAEDVPDRAAVEAQLRVLEERRRQRPAVAPPTPPPQPPAPPTGPDTPPVETPPIVPAETAPTGPAGGLSEAQILALRQAAQTILRVTQGAAAPAPSAPTAPASQPTPSAPPAQPPAVLALSPRLAEVPREDAYEERVVTATLAAQSPLDAPNATSVITAQDIRLSGLTNLGELLRRAVGVDVMSLESTDTQVGIRGFNRRLSNRVMVLLDGRSVYLDFLGVTFWSLLPVAVEEIERIEIIRGPGSALYGADAFSGVVNIITRAPGEGRNSATVGVGNALQLRAQATNAGRSGRVSYRLSAGYEQAAGYARLVGDDDRTYRVNARDPDQALTALRADLDLRAQLPGGATLRGGAAFSNGSLWFSAIGPLRRFATDLTLVQPWAELRVGGFTARAYTNHVAATAGEYIQRVGVSPFNTRVFQDVFDVELRYARTLQAGPVPVDLTLGASYRGKYISWSFLNADHLLHHFAGYAQGVARFGRRLSTVASLRVDRHPVLDAPVFSPRLAVIYRPTERRAVRLSGSTAFRTPTMLELYLDLQNPTPLPGVGVRGQGGEVFDNGRQRLSAENTLSVDVGFHDQTSDRVQYEVNAFYQRGTNLIELSNVLFDPLPGQSNPGGIIDVGRFRFANDPFATSVYGLEAALRVSPMQGLDLYGNYTLAQTTHAAGTLREGDQRTPQHKANLGAQLRTRFGLDLSVDLHYVASQVWREQDFDPARGVVYQTYDLDGYLLVNARAGYRLLRDRVELGLVGTNLTDNRARQHPFGAPLGARVMGTVTMRY